MKTKKSQNEQKEAEAQISIDNHFRKTPARCRAIQDSDSSKHPVRAYMMSVFYLIIFSRLAQIKCFDYKRTNPFGWLKKMTPHPGRIL